MKARKLVVCLIAVALSLSIPQFILAATYKLPVRTATLGLESGNFLEFENGVPVGDYNFQVDPEVLRVGEDPVTGWGYESMVIFDWSELDVIPEGTHVELTQQLTLPSIFVVNAENQQKRQKDFASVV